MFTFYLCSLISVRFDKIVHFQSKYYNLLLPFQFHIIQINDPKNYILY